MRERQAEGWEQGGSGKPVMVAIWPPAMVMTTTP